MTIEDALYYHLINNAGVSAIVGARVYFWRLPQNTFGAGVTQGALTYFVISDNSYEGVGQGSMGAANTLLQVSVWSKSYAQLITLSDAVRLALQGYSGLMGNGPGLTGVQVGSVKTAGKRDVADPDPTLYQRALGFRVFHAEAIPP